MRRVLVVAVVAGLLLTACGGGDDSTSSGDAVPAADETVAPSGDLAADAAAEDTPSDTAADTSSADAGDTASGKVINSLSDVPATCRDLMETYLKAIEPIVSSIDWKTASMADYERIATEFGAKSDEFQAAAEGTECTNLDFGDREYEILVEFAKQVAPGTADFFTFLESLGAIGSDTGSGDTGGTTAPAIGGEGFADCGEAVAWMKDLMSKYDSMMEAPLSEVSRFAQLGFVITTCTPEQQQFFQSDEFNAFTSGG